MSTDLRLPSLKAGWAGFAAICALALLLRFPVADIPLERDEGEYAYIAQRWMQGDALYRDAFDQKPPAIFVAYALIQRTIGLSPAAIHWGAQLYTLGTLALLFIIGRQLSSTAAGLAAAALGAFMTTAPGVWGNAANTELFMILPLSAAMLAACRAVERESPLWALATGALAAGALLFKQMAVTNLVFYAVFLIWASRRHGRAAALLLAGVVAVLAPVGTYFVIHGTWDALYDATIGFNLDYAGRAPLSLYPMHFWSNFLVVSRSFGAVLLLATAGVARALFVTRAPAGAGPQPRRRNTFLVLAWLAASLAGTTSGGYFTPHYFMQIVPALAVLAGMAIGEMNFRNRGAPLRQILQSGLVAGAIGFGVLGNSWYYLPAPIGLKLFRNYGITPFGDSPAVAAFIHDHSAPHDTVFILGSEPQILYYAERRSATRYFYMYPLTGPYSSASARQHAALLEIESNNPRFIVTVFIPASFLGASEAPRDVVDAIRDRLDRAYQLVGVVGYIDGGATDYPATRFVTGEAAAEAWRSAPVWYGTPAWCSLAVWQRVTPDGPTG